MKFSAALCPHQRRERLTKGYLRRKNKLAQRHPLSASNSENLRRFVPTDPGWSFQTKIGTLIRHSSHLFERKPPQSKAALRELYCKHDIMVFPSLSDSFRFVAMETMACSLPVIVTQNCGVPVPEELWRVPVNGRERNCGAARNLHKKQRPALWGW